MKINIRIKHKNSLIKLKLMQTKSYKKLDHLQNFKIESILYRLVKSFKIISKFNVSNKKILFLNNYFQIHYQFKHMLKKTNHIYQMNCINRKNTQIKNNLLVFLSSSINKNLLNINSTITIPTIFVTSRISNNFNYVRLYQIIGSFLNRQNEHFLFFVLLISLLKKKVF